MRGGFYRMRGHTANDAAPHANSNHQFSPWARPSGVTNPDRSLT